MVCNPIYPCFLGHEQTRKWAWFLRVLESSLKLILNLMVYFVIVVSWRSRGTPEKTIPNHGTAEVLTFSIATLFGIEIEMLQIFAQRITWMKTVILIILYMRSQWTLNGLSIISTTNCIAASRLHTISFFTGLETPLTASFGQDHYGKSHKMM